MQTRRTLLSQIAAITLGGSLLSAGSTATGRTSAEDTQQPIQQDSTELTVSGTPGIVGQIGLPPVGGVPFGTIGRYAAVVSPDDVDHLAGTVETRNGQFTSGSGTAVGSFDVRSIATDLHRHTAFRRIDRRKGSNAGDRERASRSGVTATASQGNRHRGTDYSSIEILAREEPASVVALEPARIDVAIDASRNNAFERLSRRRRRSGLIDGSTWNETDSGATHDSDAIAHVSLGEPMRRRLLDLVPSAAENLDRIVRGLREAGVSVEGGTDTTEVQYAFSFDDDHQATEAFTELLVDLRTHERVRLVDRFVSSSTVSVQVTMPTDSLWRVHGDLLNV